MKRRKTLAVRQRGGLGDSSNSSSRGKAPDRSVFALDSKNDLITRKNSPTVAAASISLTIVLAAAAIQLVNPSAFLADAAHQSAPISLNRHTNFFNRDTRPAPTTNPMERADFHAALQFQSIPTGASYADLDEEAYQAASEIELRRRYLGEGESDDGSSSSTAEAATGLADDGHSTVGGAADANEEGADGQSSGAASSQENSEEAAENNENPFMERHHSQLQAMQDMFERRQLAQQQPPPPHRHQHHQQQVPASQELNPISIGLEAPFGMPPFGGVGGHDGPQAPKVMGGADGPMDPSGGMGPLAFGLNPLPHLLGFPGNSAPFDGPQRGDQSAHSNSHASSLAQGSETDSQAVGGVGGVAGGQKVWPKIFRFTDGRINLSDFEKQKKIRLSNKHNPDNHIETPPIMFDNRPLKRKSFLILHGGIFSR